MPSERVLLIEDDLEYYEFIRAVLAACGEMFEVKSAASLHAAAALIKGYAPGVILVDLNLPDSSGYETFLRVRELAPATPVVVLTGLDDDQLAIRAVEDGAQDYLVKSLTQPRFIVRCVHMALSRQKRQVAPAETLSAAPASVLSFLGSKGGVGTSTTAVNIAALLALNGFKTVLMELQPGRPGTLSLYLQGGRARSLNGLLNKSADTFTPSDLQLCLVEAQPGLHVLSPACSDGVWGPLDSNHVRAIVTAARHLGRFVVLDLPAHLDEAVAEALNLSDSITLLVDRESAAVYCGPVSLEQIRMATSRNKEVRLTVINRTALELPLPIADIEKQLKMHSLASIPAAGAGIALSQTAGVPLVLLYPDDAFSVAHLELAEYLLPEAASGPHASFSSGRRLSLKVSPRAIPETSYSYS